MGIHLDTGHVCIGSHLFTPGTLDAQRIEVCHQRADGILPDKPADLHGRIPLQQHKGYIEPFQALPDLSQSSQHESVLPDGSPQEGRGQGKGHDQRRLSLQRQLLGMDQRPVVRHALVAAHPVNHRTGRNRDIVEDTDPARIYRHQRLTRGSRASRMPSPKRL